MTHTPTPDPAPTDRQQRITVFTEALVQLAAARGRPLSMLIEEQVADVPHLFRQRLALGQSPAAILDDLAVMLAACAQLAPPACSPLPQGAEEDTLAARRADVVHALRMVGAALRQPGPSLPPALAWRDALRMLQTWVTAQGLQDAIQITIR